jgi:hypothetical protein
MKIKAVVLGAFTIKIESVKYKKFVKYFPMLRRKWWGNSKEGDQYPQQWKKREMKEEEKESERRWPRGAIFIYPHGGWSRWLGGWLSTCTTIPRARGREVGPHHVVLVRRTWLKKICRSLAWTRRGERCVGYVHQSRPFNLSNSSGPALVGGSLFTPERSKEEKKKKKPRSNPKSWSSIIPVQQRNVSMPSQYLWYSQSQEISIWFCFQGWPGAKAVSNHLTMLWFMSIADK